MAARDGQNADDDLKKMQPGGGLNAKVLIGIGVVLIVAAIIILVVVLSKT